MLKMNALMIKFRHARVRPQIKVLMLLTGKAPYLKGMNRDT